jgi:hypothetical protein
VALEPFKRAISFEITDQERDLLHELAGMDDTHIRNFIRRAIKERAKLLGKSLPPEAFEDRTRGNRKPGPRPKEKPAAMMAFSHT